MRATISGLQTVLLPDVVDAAALRRELMVAAGVRDMAPRPHPSLVYGVNHVVMENRPGHRAHYPGGKVNLKECSDFMLHVEQYQ